MCPDFGHPDYSKHPNLDISRFWMAWSSWCQMVGFSDVIRNHSGFKMMVRKTVRISSDDLKSVLFCLDFEWLKVVPFLNGPAFEWLKLMTAILSKTIKNPDFFCPVFEWSSGDLKSGQVWIPNGLEIRTFEIRTIKRSVFKWIRYSNVQYSSPHCIAIAKAKADH